MTLKIGLAVVWICGELTMVLHGSDSLSKVLPELTTNMNRLAQESSPYLLQHKDNPVDWYPWGEEAFQAARRENKPVFLSVGYSTCHWCHVMNRESFSDPATAALMNKHFINIKLDREERPDVDRVYMTFVQATTGGGGWPMSVWLTPDLEPIVGGTYFPPEDMHGRPGFKSILARIAQAWAENERGLRSQAAGITNRLKEFAHQAGGSHQSLPGADVLEQALEQMVARFDETEGGFGAAPKFPRPSELLFLLNATRRLQATSARSRTALHMATLTLEKMALGGIHDHLGGGFHRYSVDACWHIPHYEKMLYDQAQLVEAYVAAHQQTGRAEFAQTARDILHYVLRDMTSPEGGFFSAEDADSLPTPDARRKSEGAFYVWTKSEVDSLLGADAPLFCAVYGIEQDGNAPAGSDPHGELTGTNTLIRRLSDKQAAMKFDTTPQLVATRLEAARKTLFEARAKRPRPHLDDKIITAWNGLMLSALAKTHQALGDEFALAAARRAATFLQRNLYDSHTKTLRRIWRNGTAHISGFAEDYAYLVRGLIDLYHSDFDPLWLAWAMALQSTQDRLFWDEQSGGYYSSADNDPSILYRMKETYDGAEPSPNSVSALNLLRLSHLLADRSLERRAHRILASLHSQMIESPLSLPFALLALDAALAPSRQAVIAGSLEEPATVQMLAILRHSFLPDATVVVLHNTASRDFFTSHSEFYNSLTPTHGKPTAYLCQDFTCQLPTTDPATLAKEISPHRHPSPPPGK